MRLSSTAGRILSYGIAAAAASMLVSVTCMPAAAGHAHAHRHGAKAHRAHAGKHHAHAGHAARGRHGKGRRHASPMANQPEFVKTPAQYLSEKMLDELTTKGRELAAKHATTLLAIENEYGVPPEIVLAIWGRETTFGTERQPYNAIKVLTSLAHRGPRAAMFRHELALARRMLAEGHISYAEMRSSEAGAMGQTQFMPSDFYRHAVDFDGDGRRDIWHSVPDTLASAAKQLADKGWRRGETWAYAVRVPASLDCTAADPELKRPVSEWLASGYSLTSDRQLSEDELAQPASLMLPAGIYGPAFLTLPNFRVIKTYNLADLYALFVGHLADRIADPAAAVSNWGDVTQPAAGQLARLQRGLAAGGYYEGKIDGMMGSHTRLALGQYEKANGLKVDCWPTRDVLAFMAKTPVRRTVASVARTMH